MDFNCPKKWETMEGESQVRNCASCNKLVHNISEMTTNAAQELISENNNCVAMQFNHNGEIKTSSGFSKNLLFMGFVFGCSGENHETNSAIQPSPTEIVEGENTDGSTHNTKSSSDSNNQNKTEGNTQSNESKEIISKPPSKDGIVIGKVRPQNPPKNKQQKTTVTTPDKQTDK